MSAHRRSLFPTLTILASNIVGLAGLSRLVGEGVARAIAATTPTAWTDRPVVVEMVVIAVSAVVLVAFWHWRPFREFRQQTRDEQWTTRGLPPLSAAVRGSRRAPVVIASVAAIVLALVLGALLPGPLAAAVALVVGAVARTLVTVLIGFS